MTPSMIVVFSSTSMIAAAFSFRKVAKVCSNAVSLSSCVAIMLPFIKHLAHRPVLLYPITICLTIWIGAYSRASQQSNRLYAAFLSNQENQAPNRVELKNQEKRPLITIAIVILQLLSYTARKSRRIQLC